MWQQQRSSTLFSMLSLALSVDSLAAESATAAGYKLQVQPSKQELFSGLLSPALVRPFQGISPSSLHEGCPGENFGDCFSEPVEAC